MPYSGVFEEEISIQTVLEVETKPHPDSLDSGQECSLEHLRQLYKLLDAENHELDGYIFDDTCLRVD
jgi:hypothetical protein